MRTSSSLLRSIVILIVTVWCTDADAQTRDRTIRTLADSISQPRLREHIDMLQRAGGHWSRVTYTPGNDSAVRYVADQFRAMPGLSSVVLDTFYIATAEAPYNTRPVFSVIATINGNTHPEAKLVIGAHIDCSGSKMGAAVWHNQWSTMRVPGADDNASGVAAVLELARVMSAPEFVNSVRNTVVFIAFGAEESGLVHPEFLVGSRRYADRARQRNERIIGMFSLDMIGYNTISGSYLNIAADGQSRWLGDHITAMNDSFSIGMTLNSAPYFYGTWSDHSPFWARGFPAVCLIENAPPWLSNQYYSANPYYHKTDDTLETLNMDLVERSAKLALVSAATLGNAVISTATRGSIRPEGFVLLQNYPNPFNSTTVISYQLSALSQTSLVVYDAIGREEAVLVNEAQEAGSYHVPFDGTHIAGGVYFVRFTSGGTMQTRKLVLMK